MNSFVVQGRVVKALFMREVLTRYGRHNIGFLWLFLEPMVFTLGVAALWFFVGANHGSNLPIISFAVTGYSSVLLWRNMPSRCIGAITPNLSLMYHRNVKVIDIFFSRLALEVVGATTSFAFLCTLFMIIGWMAYPEDILLVITGWLLLAWFGASIAIFLGALSEQTEIIEKLWHPAAYLLFPLSGAAFLVNSLPQQAQNFVLLIPMVHGTEIIRDGFFGSSITARYDISYLIVCNTAITLLGLAKLKQVALQISPE